MLRKWFFRFSTSIALLLCLTLISIDVAIGWTETGQRYLCGWVESELSQQLGLDVRVGRITGFFPLYAEVEDIHVIETDGDPVLDIGFLHARWHPLPLLWKQVRFERVRLEHVIVHQNPREVLHLNGASKPRDGKVLNVSLRMPHITVHHLDVRQNVWDYEPGVFDLKGELTYFNATRAFSAGVHMAFSDNPSRWSQVAVRSGGRYQPELLQFSIREQSEGVISRTLDLPGHPTLSIAGDYYKEHPFSADSRLDLRFGIETAVQFDKIPPPLVALLGDYVDGRATVLFSSGEPIQISDVELDGDHLSMSGELVLDSEGEILSSELRARVPNLAVLEGTRPHGAPSLRGGLHAHGTAKGNLRSPTWHLDLYSDSMRVGDYAFSELSAKLRSSTEMSHGSVVLNGLLFGSPIGITTEYSVESEGDFRFQALQAHIPDGDLAGDLRYFPHTGIILGRLQGDFQDLNLLSGIVGRRLEGSAQVDISLQAAPKGQRTEYGASFPAQSVHVIADGKQLTIDDLRVRRFSLQGRLEDLVEDPHGTFSLSAKEVDYLHWSFQDLSVDASLQDKQLPFQLHAEGQAKGRFAFDTKGTLTDSDQGVLLAVERLRGELAGQRFDLGQPIQLTFGPDQWQVDKPIQLTVGRGSAFATASSNDDELELIAYLDQIPIDFIESFIPDIPLSGTLNAELSLSGKKDNPSGSLSLDLSKARVTAPMDRPDLDLAAQLNAELENQQLHLSGTLVEERQSLAIQADIPLQIDWPTFRPYVDPEADIRAQCKGASEASSLVQLWFFDSSRIAGRLDIDLDISGSLADPQLFGSVSLSKGRYESLHTGTVFKDIRADFVANGETVTLDRLSAGDGEKGGISAVGKMQFDRDQGYPYEVALTLSKAKLLHLDRAKAKASGSLVLAGNVEGASLSGEMKVDQALVEIPKKLPVDIHTLDVTYVNAPPYRLPQLPSRDVGDGFPVTLDVGFNIKKNAILTGRGLSSEWKGHVNVRGTTAEPTLHGELKLIKGDFLFAGRMLEVNSGTATVDGHPSETTRLHVTAELPLDQATITATLHGPVKDLDLDFSSTPALPMKEIMSYALFNKPPDRISNLQGIQLAQAMLTVSGGNAAPDILTEIRRGIGLDRLEFTGDTDPDNDEKRDVSVEMGKYIGRKIFIGFTKNVEDERNSVAIEANLTKSLQIKGEYDNENAGKMWLKWHHDY